MEWRHLPGFPDYEVSEYGDIRRLTAARTRRAGHMPAGTITKLGYTLYRLATPSGKRTVWAHHAVLKAFVGPCPLGLEAAHFDGDPSNNHISNLRWATRKENAQDMARHRSVAGIRNGRALLTVEEVKEVRSRYTGKWGEQSQLAREYAMSPSAMRSILVGEHWKWET